MSKARDIGRRIRSIKNTMQLTRAMKMVSAAKLRRAQERIWSARPYADKMKHVLGSLSSRVDPELHPLLQRHGDRRVEVVLISSDRGLCGGFNSGMFRHAQGFFHDHKDRELILSCVGKKGRGYFRHRKFDIRRDWTDVFNPVEFAIAREIAGELMQRFLDGEVDEIHVAYNEFKSASTQYPVVEQVLPISADEVAGDADGMNEEHIFEPSAEALLMKLLPQHVEFQFYRAMLESVAAEHAARMTAMDAATNNARDLIESLTLTMNRLRQASITTEIIEVVSGAEALG
jgi:F-type H+-transporting ATPase subunit gamma